MSHITTTPTQERAKTLVGLLAQSRLLTELTATGKQVLQRAQKIKWTEVVEIDREEEIMCHFENGEQVLEEYLINLHHPNNVPVKMFVN